MLDLLVVVAFVIYAISSGFIASKRASQNLQEYFLAGRSISGWRAGVSMAATQFAADTPLLVMGLIATGGLFLIWQLWAYGIAFLFMGFLFAANWRRAEVLTDAELTEIRYSGKGVLALRCIKAIYYGTVINCVVLSFVLVAAVHYAQVFLPWHQWLPAGLYQPLVQAVQALDLNLANITTSQPREIATTNSLLSILLLLAFTALYSTTGGLRSVIATDVVQFMLAIVGTLIYAFIVVDQVGGLGELRDRLIMIYGIELATKMTSFAPQDVELLLPIFSIITLQWLFQMNSDGTGYLAQRTMACVSDRDARIAAVLFTWLQVVLRSLIWIVIGVGLLVLYPFDPQQLSAAGDTFKASRETVFIHGIDDLLPPGVRGIMLTGMLAALASTVDTHLNWGASYWSNDLYKRLLCNTWLKREPGNRELVLAARLSNIIILAIALVIMSQLGSIQQGWKMSLLFGAGMGSVLVLRWLWERINLYSEMAAMVISLVSGVALLQLYPEDHQEWIRLGLMALLSTSAAVGVTLFTPATDPAVLNRFYQKVHPMGWWNKTAQRCGETSVQPRRKLLAAIRVTVICAASLYLMLVGAGRLILSMPDQSLLLSLGYVTASLLLIPFWWKKVFKKQPGDD